ncbi:MAG: triose-phosphate isomerase [Dehalococcoidia bacterium]
MRTPVAAANWKCHTRLASALALAKGLREAIDSLDGVEKVLCPPFVYLAAVAEALRGSTLAVGAQDVHWQDDVAATGEVGPAMVAELATYVIIGHSERRHDFGETDEMVARKVKAALAAGLRPIMCVGETLDEREAGRTEDVLVGQTLAGLEGADVPDGFVIAYEPVWAIGTGRAATPDIAEEAVDIIRQQVAGLVDVHKAETVRVLYGGSVKPDNVAEFASRPGIDGALVGGASLDVEAFTGITKAIAESAHGS